MAGVSEASIDVAVERICKMHKDRLEFRYNELMELNEKKMAAYFVTCVTNLVPKWVMNNK